MKKGPYGALCLYEGMKRSTRSNPKLKAARKSLTVWFSNAVPVLLALLVALQEQLPAIGSILSGWSLVALSVLVSAGVSYLRVRQVKTEAGQEGMAGDA